MREQSWSGESPVDGTRGRGSLHDPVAGVAAQLRPHMPDHLEAGANILQHLGYIFAELPQPAAAVGTRFVAGRMGVDLARKMLGQRAAKRLGGGGTPFWSSGSRFFDGVGGLQVFQLELKLLDLAEDLLALRAEEHPLELLDQQLETFDLAGSRGEGCRVPLVMRLETIVLREDDRLQRRRIKSVQIGQAGGGEHERSMS